MCGPFCECDLYAINKELPTVNHLVKGFQQIFYQLLNVQYELVERFAFQFTTNACFDSSLGQYRQGGRKIVNETSPNSVCYGNYLAKKLADS